MTEGEEVEEKGEDIKPLPMASPHWLSTQVTRLCSELPEIRERALHAVAQRIYNGAYTPAELAGVCGELSASVGFSLAGSPHPGSAKEALAILSALSAAPDGARALVLAEVPHSLQRYLSSPCSGGVESRENVAAASALLSLSLIHI